MFVVRTATLAHGTACAARAYACFRDLERSGHRVSVTDTSGRPLDAARLATMIAVDAGKAPLA